MSKTNKIKQKTTGFDILYRVVTAIACLAIYPVFYFADLVHILITHKEISDLLDKLNNEGNLHATEESISLSELSQWIDMFSSFTNSEFDFQKSILQNELYRPLVVAAVFIIIALVLGLVILGFAIFSNKIKVIIGLSGAGFLSTIAAYIAFGFFANPLVAGETTLSQILNMDGIIASAIIGFLGEVASFTLDGAFWGLMFIMLGICAWSVSVFLVNKSDEKEKAMKEAARKNR
ncbi:MAG: hypothetical protein E7528_05805 [Ruminococcaceae bacterium]|nr:hypothetical protein [Oscillospiraceae bacterium]